jgi:uncharacterized protein HemY
MKIDKPTTPTKKPESGKRFSKPPWHRQIPWTVRRGALLVSALALLGVFTWVGLKGYGRWKQARLMKQAQSFLKAEDYKNAGLAAQKVLALNPTRVEAFEVMAKLADRAGSPDAVRWYERLVALRPQIAQYRIELARLALAGGHLAQAESALAGIAVPDQTNPGYPHLQAALALARKDVTQAETHAEEALRLIPTNKVYQFDLASIRLQSKDTNKVSEARATLEALKSDKELRLEVLRLLARKALTDENTSAALALTEEIQQEPRAEMRDTILRLNLLRDRPTPEFQAGLKLAQQRAAPEAAAAAELARWMANHDKAIEASNWIKSLPAGARKDKRVRMAWAECLSAAKNWKAVQTELAAEQDWGEAECVRLITLARADKETGNSASAKRHLGLAVGATEGRPEMLGALARTVVSWGWLSDATDILWKIARNDPKPDWALNSLYNYYRERGDTRELLRVTKRIHDIHPENEGIKNNLIVYSILLRQDIAEMLVMAKQLKDKHSSHPGIVSTYALALHLAGRTEEGVKVMGELGETNLKQPDVAAYYAIILAANGDAARAAQYASLARAAKLLPEERALLEQAAGAAKAL